MPVTPSTPSPSPNGATLRQRAALVAGRFARDTTRRLRRGGGTALPGLIAGTLAPDLIEAAGTLPGLGAVTVTGTNGKTTTTHLIAAIARAEGWDPLTNRSGSNLARGLVTALVDSAGIAGKIGDREGRLGIYEVDEAVLPTVFARLRPRVAVFLNLFRDQLDRYGEIDSVAEGWAGMLAETEGAPTLVLNADDPSVALLGEDAPGRVVWFGIDDPEVALPAQDHASDARFCRCGARLAHDLEFMGHVGHWSCPACGRRRARGEVAATRVHLDADGSDVEVRVGESTHTLRVPTAGLYSVTNALAAIAAAHALGIPADVAVAAVAEAGPAFGRQERFTVGHRHVRIWLAKNPAGLNEIVRALLAPTSSNGHGQRGPRYLLAMLNDDIQDGKDVSWIYDADLERLGEGGAVGALVCSGDRAEDMALRFAIAGITPDETVAETEAALDAALERTPASGTLEVIATYTAMIEVREAVATRAGAAAYWEQPT
ncbi:MAG: Mur ligase family protein [Chloroflexi bacterium]|nr:Mur ligase family protein [Chloroflexota bacterium]